eukprot:Colp12_sorted_trinity150504_noHs@12882
MTVATALGMELSTTLLLALSTAVLGLPLVLYLLRKSEPTPIAKPKPDAVKTKAAKTKSKKKRANKRQSSVSAGEEDKADLSETGEKDQGSVENDGMADIEDVQAFASIVAPKDSTAVMYVASRADAENSDDGETVAHQLVDAEKLMAEIKASDLSVVDIHRLVDVLLDKQEFGSHHHSEWRDANGTSNQDATEELRSKLAKAEETLEQDRVLIQTLNSKNTEYKQTLAHERSAAQKKEAEIQEALKTKEMMVTELRRTLEEAQGQLALAKRSLQEAHLESTRGEELQATVDLLQGELTGARHALDLKVAECVRLQAAVEESGEALQGLRGACDLVRADLLREQMLREEAELQEREKHEALQAQFARADAVAVQLQQVLRTDQESQAKVAALESRIASMHKTHERELKALHQSLDVAKEMESSLRQELSAWQGAVQGKVESERQAREEISCLQDAITGEFEIQRVLRQELHQLRETAVAQKAIEDLLRREVLALQDALAGEGDHSLEMKRELEQKQSEVSALREALAAETEKTLALQSERAALQEALTGESERALELRQTMHALESERAALQEALTGESERELELRQTVHALESERAALQEALTGESERELELRQTVHALESKLAELDTLRQSIDQLKTEAERQEHENRLLHTHVLDYQTKHEALSHDNHNLRVAVRGQEAMLKALRETISELTSAMSVATNNGVGLAKKFDAALMDMSEASRTAEGRHQMVVELLAQEVEQTAAERDQLKAQLEAQTQRASMLAHRDSAIDLESKLHPIAQQIAATPIEE